jgi:TonB family protein
MKSLFVVVVLTSLFGGGQTLALAQSVQSTGARKVIRQVVLQYPFLARQMSLSGTVRLEAVVTADGEVKTIRVEGGHPLLVQPALSAVRAWKWQKSDHETTELLEFAFKP